jgi:hypothetical protein
MRNAYKIVIMKPEEKEPFGDIYVNEEMILLRMMGLRH